MDQNSPKQKTYPDLLQEMVIVVIIGRAFAPRPNSDLSPFKTLKSFAVRWCGGASERHQGAGAKRDYDL